MCIKHQSLEKKWKDTAVLYPTLTVQRLQQPPGMTIISEKPSFIITVVQEGEILERCNLIIPITPVIQCKSLEKNFHQNHSDVNKNLSAKVNLLLIFCVKRDPDMLKE